MCDKVGPAGLVYDGSWDSDVNDNWIEQGRVKASEGVSSKNQRRPKKR